MSFDLPLLTTESIIYGAALAGGLWLVYPRLANFIEYRVLSQVVKAVTGHSTLRPRAIRVGENLSKSYDSVKRALASRNNAQRWQIRQVCFEEPIEKAIRLEGLSVLKETPEEEMERIKKGGKRHSNSLRIQVDITETIQGTQVSWKFLPEDERYFNQRLQVMDASTSLLLLRTNFNIIRELGLTG
ncbi:MAG: hypothetical protein IPM93_24365 [Candidatus Obscuribacter sp.]|nr:hypothetical protein [Candidatus Obscuribacter sp.]